MGAYHERERLCPEGVRVVEIAHVHYACESRSRSLPSLPYVYRQGTHSSELPRVLARLRPLDAVELLALHNVAAIELAFLVDAND